MEYLKDKITYLKSLSLNVKGYHKIDLSILNDLRKNYYLSRFTINTLNKNNISLKFTVYNAYILWKYKDNAILFKIHKLRIGQMKSSKNSLINNEVLIFRCVSYLEMRGFSIETNLSPIYTELLSLFNKYCPQYYDHIP